MRKNDGGPAFPIQIVDNISNDNKPGMSLRDWFAGQALAGLCANPGGPFQGNGMTGWGFTNCTDVDVTKLCMEMADSMIAAREREEL